jgi:hypothetical protein
MIHQMMTESTIQKIIVRARKCLKEIGSSVLSASNGGTERVQNSPKLIFSSNKHMVKNSNANFVR